MATAADHITQACKALAPREGGLGPRPERVREADAHARVATALALDRIADLLEGFVTSTAHGPDAETTLQPPIRHSA